MPTFGARLARARRLAKLTQDQLGERLGVTKGAISQWEHNGTEPKLSNIAAICAQLGVSADYLIRGVQVPYMSHDAIKLIQVYNQSSEDDKRRLGALFAVFGPAVSDAHVEQYLPPSPSPEPRRP